MKDKTTVCNIDILIMKLTSTINKNWGNTKVEIKPQVDRHLNGNDIILLAKED